ncbi:MAG: bifunctional diaminohydroxyphosphoribosylaminopyrimidine deaminase/5-amino-6-(5-phosphoribosylamino)uracil reductase RibD [Phycisphaerales bacterium]
MSDHKHFLDLAAKLAVRSLGLVEPNPPVGCVIVRDGAVIGAGHHRRFGGLHAERDALAAMKAAGVDPRGATAYVTLEPCNGHGKQPPCVAALIEAGVARVVFAAHDPNPAKAGGAAALCAAGIAAEFSAESPLAAALVGPFVKRLRTGLPWVIAKWAQSIDGRIATRTGESQWISGERSRRRVHEIRSRMDAIITGLGTVNADDPMLTARGVPVRRVARRVVLDADLDISVDRKLVRTARETPTIVVCDESLLGAAIAVHKVNALREAGVEIIGVPQAGGHGRLDLRAALRALVDRHLVTNVLIESGPGLMGSCFADDLVDEAVVYVAPILFADDQARPAAAGMMTPRLADARRFTLARAKPVGGDVELVYRRARTPD